MSEYIPEKRKFGKGSCNATDLESATEFLRKRELQIETVAAAGNVALTRQLCLSLRGVALSNALTARKLRDRNLYFINRVREYIESHWEDLPASKIADMQDNLDQAREKTWTEFRGHKNYYTNYTRDFTKEQIALARDREDRFGRYFPAA